MRISDELSIYTPNGYSISSGRVFEMDIYHINRAPRWQVSIFFETSRLESFLKGPSMSAKSQVWKYQYGQLGMFLLFNSIFMPICLTEVQSLHVIRNMTWVQKKAVSFSLKNNLVIPFSKCFNWMLNILCCQEEGLTENIVNLLDLCLPWGTEKGLR